MRRWAAIAWEGVRAAGRHPARSLLTAATSAVAIAVTVNVISLVYGLDEDIRRDTARFGRRTVDVVRLPVLIPGRKPEPLGETELSAVRRALEDVAVLVVPRRIARGRARGEGDLQQVGLVAAPPAYLETLDVDLAAGRWLEAAEPTSEVCVLDAALAAYLFPGEEPAAIVGRRVCIEVPEGLGTRLVVGVLADPITHRALLEIFDGARGARTLTSALLSFRNIYLPEAALGEGEYSGISAVVGTEGEVDEVVRRLHTLWPAADPGGSLLPLRGVGVFVRRDWMDVLGSTSQTGAFLSNIVWMIIVGVAVVMISTLNLLTIRERYDELAIRRVEGAGRQDVAIQVTVEGVLLATLGGLAGLPIGWVGAEVLREMVQFPFRFELPYAIAATGVSIVLGLLSSGLPARRAATLQPVQVLSRRRT